MLERNNQFKAETARLQAVLPGHGGTVSSHRLRVTVTAEKSLFARIETVTGLHRKVIKILQCISRLVSPKHKAVA